ncbi:MAG: hypothetical protein GYA51_09175 [Candidatus Methanofastidiosa archaeon]|jgi:hypothetical protein|nr:hypothetical protein [Candidatus Methanofastidiosa archaeon]
MTFERKISKSFKMDEDAWAKHANPWSGWTRTTGLPLLILAFWSRIWLGWACLIPIALSLIWIFINPRIFPKPKSTDNWMSRVVFGERVWLNRDKIPVPEYHKLAPNLLNALSASGLPFVIWGTYILEIWPTFLGITFVLLGKFWFMDRMVWLYEDMKHLPEYGKFNY